MFKYSHNRSFSLIWQHPHTSASCLNEDLVNSLMRADLVKFTYHFQHRVKLHAFNFTGKLMITIPAVCAFLRCIPVSCSSYTERKTQLHAFSCQRYTRTTPESQNAFQVWCWWNLSIFFWVYDISTASNGEPSVRVSKAKVLHIFTHVGVDQ